MTRLRNFIADVLSSEPHLVSQDDVKRITQLAIGSTFTVFSGSFRDKLFAIKYFNFTAPLDMTSSISVEVAGERLREDLANTSYEIRIMTNNILRRCPNIATLEAVFFEMENPAWIRPALIMELAYKHAPTLSDLLLQPQTPLVKLCLVSNIFDGLYALHSVRICHGDIKPDNILIFLSETNPNTPYEARISDFGFAFMSGQTPRGTGTEGWSAPECSVEPSEPLWQRKAYGRDVFSAARVIMAIFDAPEVSQTIDTKTENLYNRTMTLNQRIRETMLPIMCQNHPEDRPWVEDLRANLAKMCREENINLSQWPWIAKSASMTTTELEPVGVSAQMKNLVSTWLVNHRNVERLPQTIQSALFKEIETATLDDEVSMKADSLNALFICYNDGKFTSKDKQKAWIYLWQSARAGSRWAQGQVMYYTLETGDVASSTIDERRDWSLTCLLHDHNIGYDLLTKVDELVCERGVRAALYVERAAYARRLAQEQAAETLDQIIRDRLELPQWLVVSNLVPAFEFAIQNDRIDSVQNILEVSIDDDEIRKACIQALLRDSVLRRRKRLMYFLFSRYRVDPLLMDAKDYHSALTLALFTNRNDAVTWMLDLGISRKPFASQLIFGRIVCNSSWTMTTTYIQACWTYYRDEGLRKLLNESAPSVQGKLIPPPLILAILSENGDSLAAILRYDVDVNQQWGVWTPILLAVARGLPHFVTQLIQKGASLESRTADEEQLSVAHVLTHHESFDNTTKDSFMWEMFDRAPISRAGPLLTMSQAKRYPDYLLFEVLKIAGASFDLADGLGRLPIELAISSGKLWMAQVLSSLTTGSRATFSIQNLSKLSDCDGRCLLFYAIEDADWLNAEKLLRLGVDIDCENSLGRTCLQEAVQRGYLNGVSFCLSHGADATKQDLVGRTALNFAILNGDTPMCEELVNHGGYHIFLKRTASNETFIHCAVKASQYQTLLVLLDRYLEVRRFEKSLPSLADMVSLSDVQKRTCIHDLCNPRVELPPDADRGSAFITLLKRLLELATENEFPSDCVGDTPLHDALDVSNSDEHSLLSVRSLLTAGCEVNKRNDLGHTPLHHAYQRLQSSTQQQIISLLLERGADLQATNKYGLKPAEWGDAYHARSAIAKKATEEFRELCVERSMAISIRGRWQEVQRANITKYARQRSEFLTLHRRSEIDTSSQGSSDPISIAD